MALVDTSFVEQRHRVVPWFARSELTYSFTPSSSAYQAKRAYQRRAV
jgi:hypothetical protein